MTILLSKSRVPSKLFTHGFIFSTKSVLSHSDLAPAGLISALITTTEVIPWRALCDTTRTLSREGRWLWQISDLLDGLLKLLFSKLSEEGFKLGKRKVQLCVRHANCNVLNCQISENWADSLHQPCFMNGFCWIPFCGGYRDSGRGELLCEDHGNVKCKSGRILTFWSILPVAPCVGGQ